MKFGVSEKTLILIMSSLKRFHEIESAIIFGSRAMGNFKPGSDIDLAIKGSNITSDTVQQLQVFLNENAPSPYLFDIVHYENISENALIEHIDRFGQVIFQRACSLKNNDLPKTLN